MNLKYLPTFKNLPAHRLFDMPHTIDDLFNTFGLGENIDQWSPNLDIIESDEAFFVKIEVPAVNPEEIDITVDGRTLTIRGEKKREEKKEGENWTHVERNYGSFARTLTLPTPVADKAIEAKAVDGVLEIFVPKCKKEEYRKIKVRTK